MWDKAWHNWCLEVFLLILLGTNNVKSPEGLKCYFRVLKCHAETLDTSRLDINDLGQGSTEVKIGQIYPQASKGVINVLKKENNYTNIFALQPWRIIITPQELANNNFASGCLVFLVCTGPIRTVKFHCRPSKYPKNASKMNSTQ